MKNPTDARIEKIFKMAREAFAKHQIEQRLGQGLWRSWRCRRPDDWAYGFDVTTGPGWLMIRGDLGAMMWERTEDMLPWCRSAIRDINYLAEKVPCEFVTEEYDPLKAEWWLAQEIAESESEPPGSRNEERLCKLQELEHSEFDNQHQWTVDLHDAGVCDGMDWPSFNSWTHRFLWLREALRWFLNNVDKAQPCTTNQPNPPANNSNAPSATAPAAG